VALVKEMGGDSENGPLTMCGNDAGLPGKKKEVG